MAIEVKGKILKILETQQISEKFSKREFVVEVEDGKYPQMVLFQMTGDRCAELDKYQEGQEVSLQFNLRGREWTSPKGEVRHFNSLDVWRIASLSQEPVMTPGSDAPYDVTEDEIPF